MGNSDTAPRWVRTHASELVDGNRFRVAGQEFKVSGRTYTDAWSLAFRVQLTDGTEIGMLKSSVVEIFDPDGSVAERVIEVTW